MTLIFIIFENIDQTHIPIVSLNLKIFLYTLSDFLELLRREYYDLTCNQLLKLLPVLLVVIKDCCDLRISFGSLQLIDLVCKCIGSDIILKRQLKLCYYPLIEGNLKRDIRDRHRFGEPTLNFQNPELLWINFLKLLHVLLNVFDRLNNILDFGKGAFPSDHIADSKFKRLLAF